MALTSSGMKDKCLINWCFEYQIRGFGLWVSWRMHQTRGEMCE